MKYTQKFANVRSFGKCGLQLTNFITIEWVLSTSLPDSKRNFSGAILLELWGQIHSSKILSKLEGS